MLQSVVGILSLPASVNSDPAWLIDKEIDIIHELGQRVLEFEDMLCKLSDVLGELDR